MCAIAGSVPSDSTAPGDAELVGRMARRLAHRGPDGQGVRALQGCALGHARLAIIDLSERAAQPMANEDESLWLVCNGEIYNHIELRRELEGRHEFRSGSDCEVILHLYEEAGDRVVERLRGMFAFALWDVRRRRLLVVRDRVGKKPVYYRESPAGIDFASEIPALLEAGGALRFDHSTLSTYLALGYIPAPATGVEGIRRLEAGSLLVYEEGAARISRWWSPPLPAAGEGAGATPASEAGRFLALLEESVALRLRSDVPVGVFLSGGIDSAIVAALAAKLSPEPVRTFTVVFEESGYDESVRAAETARAVGSVHSEIRVVADAASNLPALIRGAGEPFADSSLVAVHGLSRAVAAEVKVALSGDGGDELFLGYDRYRAHRLAERWARLPAAARSAATAAAGAFPGARGRRNIVGRAARFVDAASGEPLGRNDRWICRFHPSEAPELLTEEAAALQPPDPLAALHHLYSEVPEEDPLDAVARADVALWLPEDVLRKVDTASMACSLEVRSPLLDQRIVEAASRLPARVRMPGTRGKEILRHCARRLLPARSRRAPKRGFGLPLDLWLRRGRLGQLARDTLGSESFRSRGLFRQGAAERLLDAHASGEANHDEAIWTMMVLEIFLREVIDGRAA